LDEIQRDVIFDVQDLDGSYGVGDHFQAQLSLSDLESGRD
jgi:hypothetical protein